MVTWQRDIGGQVHIGCHLGKIPIQHLDNNTRQNKCAQKFSAEN